MAKKLDTKLIRELREKTGAPVMQVKRVLDDVKGDRVKAEKILKEKGFEKAAKRAGRQTSEGVIAVYLHHNKKVAAMVELLCETDFVARNELFTKLADDLAMQIASLEPKNVKELLAQDFIKEPSKKIEDLVKEVIAKTGENVKIGRLERLQIGG